MKKLKLIIPIILAVAILGAFLGYFIYGSTLIDITNEKSISNHLAVDPEQPITILKTAKNGEYFGILYSDPTDEDEGCYHFAYITKAKLYKNKYHNIGGSGTSVNDPYIGYAILNGSDTNKKTVEVFLYTFNSNLFENNTCSVFEYDSKGTEIIFEEITDEKQIIEKRQKLADSYKKIDEFKLPNEVMYIIPKNYELSPNNNQICFVNGSVSVKDLQKQTMDDADLIVKEYRQFLKEESNEKNIK